MEKTFFVIVLTTGFSYEGVKLVYNKNLITGISGNRSKILHRSYCSNLCPEIARTMIFATMFQIELTFIADPFFRVNTVKRVAF